MYSMDYMHFGNGTDRLWDRAKVEVVKINQTKVKCPHWRDGSPEEKHDLSWTAALAGQRTNFSTFIEETILDGMWLFSSKANFLRWSWMICQCQTLKMLLNIHIIPSLLFFPILALCSYESISSPLWSVVARNRFQTHLPICCVSMATNCRWLMTLTVFSVPVMFICSHPDIDSRQVKLRQGTL